MTSSRRPAGRVAVLGAGIMGCSVALLLARQGHAVTLFDQAPRPFEGASGWNEGKLHLGYLYAADSSLATARQVLPGALGFADIVRDLIGEALDPALTPEDDHLLLHRDSVADTASVADVFARLDALVAAHPGAARYPGGAARGARRLAAAELDALVAPGAPILAGWRVPERSVNTQWLAARYRAALAAEPRIEPRMGTRIGGLRPLGAGLDGPFAVATASGEDGPYALVVNALWEGRPAVDASLGLPAPREMSHRYRLALFLRMAGDVALRSALIGTGPFGDVKAYGPRDLYMSWYPAGMLAQGQQATPPPLPAIDRDAVVARILDGLAAHLRDIRAVAAQAEQVTLAGGWVYAQARGALSDPKASIHGRARFGILRQGNLVSVDTGKFSSAPWLAREVAAMVAGA
jgi:glycine/D-amino acid oxidase-like deaminating enzyme